MAEGLAQLMSSDYISSLKTIDLLINDLTPTTNASKIFENYEKFLNMKRSNIFKHFIFSKINKRIPYHNQVLLRILKIRTSVKKEFQVSSLEKPMFLVRVDDFPRWDRNTAEFMQFHKILAENEIPYLLGVIPFPSLNPLVSGFQENHVIEDSDIDVLRQITKQGVEVAMHGVTHQTTNSTRPSEIVGVKKEELEEKIKKGKNKLDSEKLQTDFFIPPFNTFDIPSIEIISKYFKVICGGPESVLYVGLRISPSYLRDTLYIPSYYPSYGRTEEILPFINNVKNIGDGVVIPLTLHWAWEAKSKFINLEKFCKAIHGQTLSWNCFTSKALDRASQIKS
jgi:hypothetical protein